MKLKRCCIIGLIFVWITGSLFHFVYEWSGGNTLVGLFFPVNESTWEHMKLIFFPMILFSIFLSTRLSGEFPCVNSALLSGTLFGTFLIPVLFYTYTGILGFNYFLLDISTFLISAAAAFSAVYKLSLSCRFQKYTPLLCILTLIVFEMFLIFTYFPPSIGLFADPLSVPKP